MAQLRVLREEPVGFELPRCCARCGKPATEQKPIPVEASKEHVHLSLPLCEDHLNHWSLYRKRSRRAKALILLSLIHFSFIFWHLFDPMARGRLDTGRLASVAVCSLLSSLLLGIGLLIWIGGRISVIQVTPARITLDGVSRELARAWSLAETKARLLPELSEEGHFEVEPYQPDYITPGSSGLRLIFFPLLLSVIFGLLLALATVKIAEWTAGWQRNDLAYLGLITGVVFIYSAIGLWARRTIPTMMTFVSISLLALTCLGCAGFVAWIKLFTLSLSLKLALNIPALVLIQIAVHRQITVNHIRDPRLALFAGAMAPLVFAAISFFAAGGWDGPQFNLLILGPIAAMLGAAQVAEKARSPFCTTCEQWMNEKYLGVIRRRPEELNEILSSGQLLRLAGESIEPLKDDEGDDGDSHLKVYYCPDCLEEYPVVVELISLSLDNNKNLQKKQTGIWKYPGEAWFAIQEIFPFDPDAVNETPSEDPTL